MSQGAHDGVETHGGERGDGNDEAVDEHGGTRLRRGDDGTGQRGNLQATDASEDLLRRRRSSGNLVRAKRCRDDAGLVAHALCIEPGAGADELLGRRAEQRCGDGRGSRRVADAHLAEDDEVGAIVDRALTALRPAASAK